MKIPKVCFAISQIAILLLTLSCSNSEDPNEKGAIKKTQDKIAQEATSYIKEPINKAKIASELADEHNQQIKDAQKQ